MKKTLRALAVLILTLSAGAGILLPSDAAAQTSRVYLSGYMGLNTFGNDDFSESATPDNGTIEFKNAISFAGALGLRLSQNWRIEAELSYRNADANSVTLSNGSTERAGGNMRSFLTMANVYYDFDFSWKNLSPFVGAGLGVAWHDGAIRDIPGLVDGSDTNLGMAWQLGGGLKYRMGPGSALTGGYRYVGTTDIDMGAYTVDYDSHEFRLGLEYDLPVDWLKGQ